MTGHRPRTPLYLCLPGAAPQLPVHALLAARRQVALAVARHGGRVEMTVTDVDGVELATDPGSSTLHEFVIRAEAAFDGRTPMVGISDPVDRDVFVSIDHTARHEAERAALLDLLDQIRPHTRLAVVSAS